VSEPASSGALAQVFTKIIGANGLVSAFVFVGAVVVVSSLLGRHLARNRVHGSAFAVLIGLALAYWGGLLTGGKAGLADIKLFAGVGLLGGAMFRDFTIVSTAFEVNAAEARKAGWLGPIALLLGTIIPFVVGVAVAWAFGYRDAISLTTIGAGAVTYIVGPVTGSAIGASSDVMALSIATGVTKAILVMIYTPHLAKFMRLDNPRAAMVFGGLAGTVSGVSAGLAATDRRLVPYGALVATFHTGLGCLMGPSVLYLAVKAFAS
jgi:malonate transporter MadM subunit